MTIKEKLIELFDRVNNDSDVEAEFEKLGMYDHVEMRAFGQEWGTIIAEMTHSAGRELDAADVGSSMVGGILLGLLLAEDGFLRVPFPTAGGSQKGGGA